MEVLQNSRIHYKQLYKSDLSEILYKLLVAIESDQWGDVFPTVWGYEHIIPDGYENEEAFPKAYRSSEHAIAYETLRHTDLHREMTQVVKAVTQKNNLGDEPLLTNIFEHAGTHYATELAMYHKQYVRLYADFLLSNNLQYECYQSIDFVRIMRHWGWCPESYYLLFARWFAGGEYCSDDIKELCFHNSLKECFEAPEETNCFLSALADFLVNIKYDADNEELNNWVTDRFKELLQEHIYRPCNFVFPENVAKAEALISCFPEVFEKLKNAKPIESSDNTPFCVSNGMMCLKYDIDIFQQYDDDDIPEI